MELIKGTITKPFKLVLYGPPGVGKSTLANNAPKPVFIDVEDALHKIDCIRTPVIKNWASFRSSLQQLCSTPDCKTIVIDTADALEDLIVKQVCAENNKKSLGDFGFGKGYEALNKYWSEVIEMLDYIARQAGKNTVLVGHSIIRRYEDPMHEGYDRYTLKMHTKSAATVTTRADAVVFMDYEKIMNTTEKGINKAIGTGRRVLYCNEKPAFTAKNRYQLPDTVAPAELFNLMR